MRRQGQEYSHFTDVDSKAERGKATCPKLHSCVVAEPGLEKEASLAEFRALSRAACALEFLKRGEVRGCGERQISPLDFGTALE